MSKKPLRYFARQQDEGNKPKQEDARQLSQQEDEDEDYMSMAFEEPAPSRGKETYAQRVKRKQREVCDTLTRLVTAMLVPFCSFSLSAETAYGGRGN